jgi:membrane protease YdiL (CAAX protease family)
MRVVAGTLLVYLVAVGAVLGLQLVAMTGLVAARGGTFDLERDGLAALLVGVPASSLALIGVAWGAAGVPRGERLRLRPSRAPARAVAAMAVGTLALSQGLESLSILIGVGPGANIQWISRSLAAATPAMLVLAVLVVGALAPLGEELFFRGYMQTRLRRVWSVGPAVLVTALAFGLIHGEWIHGAMAAGLGVYLGLVAERTVSVVPPVICHMANNTVSALLSATVGSPQGLWPNGALLVVSAVVFAASLRWMARRDATETA